MAFWHNSENFRLHAYILNLFNIAQIEGIIIFMPGKNKVTKERFSPFLPPKKSHVCFFFFFKLTFIHKKALCPGKVIYSL